MPLPPANTDALLSAMQTFDRDLRGQPDWSSWEANRAQTYALVSEGRRYPPKKIVSMATGVPVSDFSGGPETNTFLEERGFTVERIRSQTLADTLKLILERYGHARKNEAFKGHHVIRELFEEARRILTASEVVKIQTHLHVHASYGKGNWATIPWISILDDRETTTTQDGTYIVYLFRDDGAGCYVKLAQGVTKVERELGARATEELGRRAADLRARLGDLSEKGFDLSGLSDMATDHRLAKLYEASTIAAKYYPASSIPTDDSLFADLRELVDAYARVVDARPAGARVAADSRPIALVGTWKGIVADLPRVERFIADHGGMSSPWSFVVKSYAAERLQRPFYLYLNAGGGELPVRMRIEEFRTKVGSEGMTSPWPELTEDQYRGIARSSDKQSEIWRTWLRVSAVERLSPARSVRELDLVHGLSTPENVLNQNTFGYVHEPDDSSPLETEVAHEPVPMIEVDANPDLERFDFAWLQRATGLESALLSEMVGSLRGRAPQIVLSGPPGTGKSWVAKQLAQHITGGRAAAVRFVQFHPGYSYESFVEGLRPVTGPSGIAFALTPGVVIDVVNQMRERGELGRSDRPYVIIIDELNRANLPRVLGELMYLLEYRNESIQLQHSPGFSLPSNLCFICTMNTTDRSVRSIDAAMRRRFEMFELMPSQAVLREFLGESDIDVEEVVNGLSELNGKLSAQLDRHHTIGHSFFMKPGLAWGDIRRVWDRRLLPLIEEYFYDQPDLVADYKLAAFWPSAADD